LPIYGDTIFTVAAAFSGGLVPGILTGALTNLVVYPLISSVQVSLEAYLFAICSIAAALVTWFFAQFIPRSRHTFEDHLAVCVALIALSIALVAVESVTGGLVATLFANPISGPEALLQFGFYQSGFPRLATEILSRVPVNLIDRPISVFGGYAAALFVRGLSARCDRFSCKFPPLCRW
jgi:hypothetical protein